MRYGLGIDLGTSFVKAAVSRDGRARMAALTEHSVLLTSTALTEQSISRQLRAVVDDVTAGEGRSPDRIVLVHPAGWEPERRDQLERAATGAGLRNVRLVPQAEAVAFQHAGRHPLPPGAVVAVHDLGASGLDVALVRVTGTSAELIGVPHHQAGLGGDRLDQLVLDRIEHATGNRFGDIDPDLVRRIRADATRAKEQLSRVDHTSVTVLRPGRTDEVPLGRAELDTLIGPVLEQGLVVLRRSLSDSGVGAADLAGVLLAGGSSRIPLVATMVGAALDRPVLTGADPQHAAALGGAALAAAGLPPAPSPAPVPVSRSSRRLLLAAPAVAVLLALAALATQLGGGRSPGRDQAGPVIAVPTRPGVAALPTAAVTTAPVTTGTTDQDDDRPEGTGGSGDGGEGGDAGQAGAEGGSPRNAPTTPAANRPQKQSTDSTGTTKKKVSKAVVPDFAGAVTGLGGLCLDVANGRAVDGAVVQIATCNGSKAQNWSATGDGTVRVVGMCLAEDTQTDQATTVGVMGCDGGAGQTWRLKDAHFVSSRTGSCLAVRGGKAADRTPLVEASCRDVAAQRWQVP